MAIQTYINNIATQLPGWQIVVFISMVLIVTIVSGILIFRYMSNLRWNYFYTALQDVAGRGLNVSKQGRCRLVAFGDGGEEIFLLKGINKYRAGYGKRIGHNKILWVIADDGYWYQSDFQDFNKKLREMGVRPISKDQRFSNASIRKGLENRFPEQQTWLQKYGPILFAGMFIMGLLILFAIIWYSTNKQIQIASINAEAVKTTKETQEISQKTLSTIDNILSRLDLKAVNPQDLVGGSGLTPS